MPPFVGSNAQWAFCTLIGIREKPAGERRRIEEGRGRGREEEKEEKRRKKEDVSGQYGCAFVPILNLPAAGDALRRRRYIKGALHYSPNNKKNSCLVGFLGY